MISRLQCLIGWQLVALTSWGQINKGTTKPNILWVTIEDTSPAFVGAYGNTDARTPTIDMLAKNGVMFLNAFSNNTVCSPSRATIISGVKTTELGTGHHRSTINFPAEIKGFPSYLRTQGYYTTNNFKTDYNVANSNAFIKEAWDESSANATWRNRKPGQPFFAVFNYAESHQSRTMSWSYQQYKKEIYDILPPSDRIGDNDFKVPPIYHDSPEMRKQLARVYNSLKVTDNVIEKLLKQLDNDGLRDSTIIFFYADHGEGMPRGKTNGIDYGHRVPFVIWFPAMYSHLSPWGKAGVVSDELISFEDLAPTILSIAGATIPSYMKGRILMVDQRSPEVKELYLENDRADNGPDLTRSVSDGRYIYSRSFMPFMPELRYIRYFEISVQQQMRKDNAGNILNKQQQSFFLPRQPEYLFDVETDPWELNNLATNKNYRNKLNEFREKLNKNIITERDILLLPEYETELIQRSTTLYKFRQNAKNFPIGDIYHAVSLSGFRDKETCRKQISLLTNSNKIIRYWAIVGIRSQPDKLLKKYKMKLLAALNDTYPPVAVTAAVILYELEANKTAKEILKQACLDDNMEIALMAINYLLYVKNDKPFENTINTVKKKKNINYPVKAACNDYLGKNGLIDNNVASEDQLQVNKLPKLSLYFIHYTLAPLKYFFGY
ncbi:MAG: sulfatase [Chitinophagaceae bacterium]